MTPEAAREGRAAPGSLEAVRPASRRQRRLRAAVVFLLSVTLCAFLDLQGFAYLEKFARNVRLAMYASRNRSLREKARGQIVLVTTSDDTFADGRWPGGRVPRECQAKVLRELARAGAKVIAFDFVFDADRPGDKELADAARDFGRVVWACSVDETGNLLLPNARLRDASPHWGHIRLPQAAEQQGIDAVRPALEVDGRPVPAFSVQVAALSLGLKDEPIHRAGREYRMGTLRMPVDATGRLPITYLKAQDFPVVPFELVYDGAVDDPFYRDNHFFEGKIVLLGSTVTLDNDVNKVTPVGLMPGVEIHAHAVATLLQQRFIREAPGWANLGLLCALAGGVCVLSLGLRLRRAVVASFALVLAFAAANVWIFLDTGLSLHLVAPTAGALLALTGMLIDRGVLEERERQRRGLLLQRYVSPQVADYILDNPDACSLGGRRAEGTILFSDIRGFTSLCGRLPAEEAVARLNEYFQTMVDIIFVHEGVLDKYVGDALMALFGVLVPQPDHAHRAVSAAIAMQAALLELQARWRERGIEGIDIGIGVHTGEMVSGNIGARQRMDFTVIGDTVNIAAHVESLTRQFGCRILVTEETFAAVRSEVVFSGPFPASAKGRPVNVYHIDGWVAPAADPAQSRHGEVLAAGVPAGAHLHRPGTGEPADRSVTASPTARTGETHGS